jgi:hypothetical protein
MVLTFVYSRIKAMHGCFASEAAIIMCNNSPLYTLIICPNLLEGSTIRGDRPGYLFRDPSCRICKPGRLTRSFLKRTSTWHDQSEEMRLQ